MGFHYLKWVSTPIKIMEVNKNNLLGGQGFFYFFFFFCLKIRKKIINCVGSLQFLSALTQIIHFLWKFLRYVTFFKCHRRLIHNVHNPQSHEDIVQRTYILTNFRTAQTYCLFWGCLGGVSPSALVNFAKI